jgi:DNA-binding response OmpR family regulator
VDPAGSGIGAPDDITVIVADDDPGIRQVLEFVFNEEGFDVHLTASAAETRQAATTISRGVVVLDLKLGRDDGLELARDLAARQDLALVMVSAEPSLARRAATSDIAPDAVLTKPFRVAELVAVVRRQAARLEIRLLGAPEDPD